MIVSFIDYVVPGDMSKDLTKMAMLVEVLSLTLTNSFIIPQLVFFIAGRRCHPAIKTVQNCAVPG